MCNILPWRYQIIGTVAVRIVAIYERRENAKKNKKVIVILAGTRENSYQQLKSNPLLLPN